MNWQRIENASNPAPGAPHLGEWRVTDRAPVPGGWLVRTYVLKREVLQVAGAALEPEMAFGVGLTFVPDPGGAWKA